jgi:two-component system chemotaxis response regulator CheB
MNHLNDPRQFKAIVIGASAGGIDAMLIILSAIPADFQLPIVLILHLPSGAESRLPELVAHHAKISAKEAFDKEKLERGVIYIAPSNYHLLIDPDRCFSLSAEEPLNYSRPSIDILFQSAADAFGEELVGVLLTGANEDGVQGLKAIQRQGGYTLVQDPKTAVARTMPDAALKSMRPDGLMTLNEIGDFLAKLKEKTDS